MTQFFILFGNYGVLTNLRAPQLILWPNSIAHLWKAQLKPEQSFVYELSPIFFELWTILN